MIKVFLCGEGNNDLGTRWHKPRGDDPGVLEALLRRVRADGWHIECALDWKSIRKYRAGAGLFQPSHKDARNVHGLVLRAYEEACEMLVFVRDRDNDDERGMAIDVALESIAALGFAEEFRYKLIIVGGIAHPTLEGWILCLLGVAGTDEMTATGASRALAAKIPAKSTAAYVEIAQTNVLPTDDGSLARWLALAQAELNRLIDGTPGA
jgi:hypothetical protein